MVTRPTFSILVPSFNQAQYLPAALDSLLAQTDSDWEAIVVNDGSEDSTPQVIAEYERRDARIRRFDQPNGGTSVALNTAFARSRGEWICWLSSDDLFDPHKLEIHRQCVAENPHCDFFFSHYRHLAHASGRIEDRPLWFAVPERRWQVMWMLRGNYVHGNSICVRRQCWQSCAPVNVALRYGHDYDLWLRLLVGHPGVFINQRTCITREHPQQTGRGFPDAGFFDSAKSGIALVNSQRFESLFPAVDLAQPGEAEASLEKAMEVATEPKSIVYSLGPHPCLALRIVQWLAACSSRQLRQRYQRLCDDAIARLTGTPLGIMWQAVAQRMETDYIELTAASVAQLTYQCWLGIGHARCRSLGTYLGRFEQLDMSGAPALSLDEYGHALTDLLGR